MAIGAKSDSATVSHDKQEEDISRTGQSISPMAGKPLYIWNREMSDKLRIGL